MIDYELRPAVEEDCRFLFKLLSLTLREYVEEYWGWDDKFQWQRFRGVFEPWHTEVIQVHGEDIGCLVLHERPEDLYLAEIQILPEYQGQGLGTAVLREVIGRAHVDELPVALQVLKNNPARGLYERLGFEHRGQNDFHYLMMYPAPR